jgi:hypothetical protein
MRAHCLSGVFHFPRHPMKLSSTPIHDTATPAQIAAKKM